MNTWVNLKISRTIFEYENYSFLSSCTQAIESLELNARTDFVPANLNWLVLVLRTVYLCISLLLTASILVFYSSFPVLCLPDI